MQEINIKNASVMLALAAGLGLHAWHVYAPCDDAYIYLVYVNSLFNGNGLTYNGALVQGFSSILWPWLISLVHLLGPELPDAMQALSFFSGVFVVSAIYFMGCRRGLSTWQAAVPALGLTITGDFAFYSGNGLETILFSGLVLVASGCLFDSDRERFSRRHDFILPVLFVLVLVRPEGLLVSFIIVIWRAYRAKSISSGARALATLAVMLAPVYVFIRLSYGSWLPATYYAKSGAGLDNLDQGLTYLALFSRHYAPVLALLACAFLLRWQKIGSAAIPLLMIFLAWIAQTTLQGGDNMVGFRMYLAVIPLCYFTIGYAFRDDAQALTILALLAFGYVFWGYNFGNVAASSWAVPVEQQASSWRSAFIERKAAGLWLKENFPAGSRVALSAAGITPYYSELPTIDMLGLNDGYIALHGHRDRSLAYAHQAGDGAYVMRSSPDVIFLFEGLRPGLFVSDREIWQSREFQKEYIPCKATEITWVWVKLLTITELKRKGIELDCRKQEEAG